MGYGQNDDARRYEEQRRADEARHYEEQRQNEERRWEQKRYEQQKADDDRRYYERKQETARQNRAYAEHKQEENAAADSRHRENRLEGDREHQEATDAYHQSLQQEQSRSRAQEEERYLQEQRQRQSSSASGGPNPGGDDGAMGSLIGLTFLGFFIWAAWQGLQKFWLFTTQWPLYDIPLRWIGQFYKAIFYDLPMGGLARLSGGSFDSLKWILGGVAIVALLGLIVLVKSRVARRLFAISLFIAITPAVLGGGCLLWFELAPKSAESAKNWLKARSFYTAQVNGAEINTSTPLGNLSWFSVH